ncbi:hypothetical protein MTO96_005162 [Rhipicephalus appendiculatus]
MLEIDERNWASLWEMVQLLILNVLAFWSAVNAGGLHPATEGFSHTIAHPDGSTHHSTFIRHNTDVVPRDHESGVYDPQSGHVVSVHSAGVHGYGAGASHVVASRPLGAYGSAAYGGAAYGGAAYGTLGAAYGALGAYGAYAAPPFSVAAAPAVSVAAAPAVAVAHAPAVSVAAPAATTVRGPFINNRVVQTAFGDVHTPHHEFHHHEHHTVHPTGGTAFAAFKK